MTTLPIIVKGITAPEDTRAALDQGVDGIVVSNHGGRQVDGAIAALDALPNVAAAVAERVPLLFDSGIRTGSDAFKALALGARAVLLGRPYLWGLAIAGERGVSHVLRSFLCDLDLTCTLAGYGSLVIGPATCTRSEVCMPKVSEAHLAARRQQILDAALTCFDRDGFHGARPCRTSSRSPG